MNEVSEKFFKYVKVEEVLDTILKNWQLHPRVIEVDAVDSIGFVLAEDVVSTVPIPKNDIAHFDGYAVRSSDTLNASTTNPIRLKIVERIDLISDHDLYIGKGEAAYVVTGAKIPENSDSVIPVERAKVYGDYIEIVEPAKKGEHITSRGADVQSGEIILRRGDIIRSPAIRYLLDIGKYRVKVYAKPRVALIGIGDELTVDLKEVDGRKLETSSIIVSHYVREFGAIPIRFKVIQDSPEQIAETTIASLRENDICVTIGGVSLGTRDLCWTTLSNQPDSMPIARGLRVQPGRATSIVLLNGKPVIMLPGHIQSTMSGMINILIPLICYLQGLPIKNFFPRIRAEMAEDLLVKEYVSFERIRFVQLIKDKDRFIAKPILGDSSMIKPLLLSSGFIRIPEKIDKVVKGSKVDVYLLSWSDILNTFLKE